MGFFNRNSDDFTERLLADPPSVEPEAGVAETVAFVRALPAAVPALPEPALEARIVPALAAAARSATLQASQEATTTMAARPSAGAPRWRLRVAALAAVVAAVPVLMAGLAYAGVDLPDPVDDAFEAVGVDLPNQSDADGVPAAGQGKGDSASKNAAGTDGSKQGATQGDGDATDAGNRGKAKGKPGHAGPEETPPGHGGTPPGQGGVPPGNAGVPPGGGSDGATGPPPETGPPATPPGQGGTPPGQGSVPPGQG
jgi:hypothetical protein